MHVLRTYTGDSFGVTRIVGPFDSFTDVQEYAVRTGDHGWIIQVEAPKAEPSAVDKVKDALAALPDTPRGILEHLKGKVRGNPGSPTTCPLAAYLKRVVGEDVRVRVGPASVKVSDDVIELTPAQREFVYLFDGMCDIKAGS